MTRSEITLRAIRARRGSKRLKLMPWRGRSVLLRGWSGGLTDRRGWNRRPVWLFPVMVWVSETGFLAEGNEGNGGQTVSFHFLFVEKLGSDLAMFGIFAT